MRRVPGTMLVFCLAFGLCLQAQAQFFPNSPAASAPPRLEVVGTDYTTPTPEVSCNPYDPYDPSCSPTGGGGPNYGSGTSNYSEQHFVPYIISGGGFITIITITNLTSASNSGQLLYWGVDGSTLSRTTFTLPAGATMRVQTPESSRFGASTTQWLTVSTDLDAGINSFFELRDSSGNVLNTIGFNDPQEGTSFSIPVEFTPGSGGAVGHTVGLAVADDTSAPANVTLNLYDSGGKLLASAARSLSAFGLLVGDLSTFPEFQGVLPASDFVGTLTVTSNNVVSHIALEDDLGPFYSTPGLMGPSFGQLVVPHIITGGGFVTRLTLMNMDTVNSNAFDVKFFNQSGTLLQEQTVNVPPSGTGRLSTGESTRFNPTQISWALVTASSGAAVNTFFELENGSGRVINTIGFNHAQAQTDFTIPVEFMPSNSSIGRTVGVGIANPSSTAANVTLKLVDANANVVASTTLTINPNAQQSFDLRSIPAFAAALPASDFVGVLTVNASVPVSTIALGDDFGPFYSTPVMSGRAQ